MYKNDNLLKILRTVEGEFRFFTVWSLGLYIFSKFLYPSNALLNVTTILVISCSLIGSPLIYCNFDDFAKMLGKNKKQTMITDFFVHILPLILVFFVIPLPTIDKSEYLKAIIYYLGIGIGYLYIYKPSRVYRATKLNDIQLVSLAILTQIAVAKLFFV